MFKQLSMPIVQILTNPNKNIEEKANFFADYFHFFAKESGKLMETEPENVLSIVEKILFQLENNRSNIRTQYITNHLNHTLLKDISFLNLFPAFKKLRPFISKYLAIEDIDKRKLPKLRLAWLKDNIGFRNSLMEFHEQLGNSMFEVSMREIIKMLSCEHNLKKHQKALKSLTQVLVSELIMKGRTKKDIINVFDRILNKMVDSFPFPKSINTSEAKLKHLANLDFYKQFRALVDYYLEDKKAGNIYLKVQGASLKANEEFQYSGIRFISSIHSEFQTILEHTKEYEQYYCDTYFGGDNYFVAIIHVKAYAEISSEPVLNKLHNAINYLELIISNKLSVDHTKFLIGYDSGQSDFKFSGRPDMYVITGEDIKAIQDNPFNFLEHINSAAKELLLRNEKTYINAILRNDIDGLWKYLENLYPQSSDKVMRAISEILLLNEKKYRQIGFVNSLRNNSIPWQFNYHKLGISPDTYLTFYNNLMSKHKEFVKLLNYPLFNEISHMLNLRHTKNRYLLMNEFYKKILMELYENRNFIAHQNIINDRARQKILEVMPVLLKRFRWILFEYIRKNPTFTMSQVIEKASTNGAKMFLPKEHKKYLS